MVQVLHTTYAAVFTEAAQRAVPGARSRHASELRAAAEDLAGRVDRDELSFDDELRLSDALDAAVEAALPQMMDALDEALTPRLEALPLRARLTLARARARRELGLE